MSGARQPSGEVTLVFTDIEGSTRLLEELGTQGYRAALAEHRRIVREACARHAGYEVDYEGDAFFYAFPSAPEAVSAVSEAMAGLEEGPIAIRVGIHTGTPEPDPPKYVGMDVHTAARIMSSGHGGQVVISPTTAALVDVSLHELGEHRLKDIEHAVPLYQLGEGSFPPLKTISNTNLPRPASSFVGREHELEQVLAKIAGGARLLTLSGPGGTGKTRLALEAAATLVSEYKAGVFWVGLASLRDAALVTETISQVLGAKNGLAAHIAEREQLLLLDNLEQVIDSAPELSQLLQVCPNLTLLVTSREVLRVSGEVEYPVPPLASPEAVALFCERSQLDPTEEIAELCARLDSLPLAVELAAARTKALTPAQILDRLSGRLDLLKGGRDADPRQQTLRATIAWSHELLSSAEQKLFARLSVFAGGCTLEAAQEVADADLDMVQSLVEKSLLRFSTERYWMLETIREYAAERLASEEGSVDILSRLASFLCASLAEPTLTDRATWVLALETERDNLRAALRWALDHCNDERRLELSSAYGWLCMVRGPVDEGASLLVAALGGGAKRDTVAYARARWGLGALAWRQGDNHLAQRCYEECLAIARSLDDRPLIGRALRALGILAAEQGRVAESTLLLNEALAVFRDVGDAAQVDECLNMLGYGAMVRGDYATARAHIEEALASSRRSGHSQGIMRCVGNLASIATDEGRYVDALALSREGLDIACELDDIAAAAGFLAELAFVAADQGSPHHCAILLGGAEALNEASDASFDARELERRQHALAVVAREIETPSVHGLLAAGRGMTLDELVAQASEVGELERLRP